MSDASIPPAAVRLYHHMLVIEVEVQDAITDSMGVDEFLAYIDHIGSEAEARTMAATLAGHAEYQAVKAEIGRLLGIGAGEIHPLDLMFSEDEAVGEDDPRYERKRALGLLFQLDRQHLDWLCCRQRPRPVEPPGGMTASGSPSRSGAKAAGTHGWGSCAP